MPALAVPFAQWRDGAPTVRVDNLVIGSGYGGAVAALRLAEAGQAVTVLERGGEYLPGDFPNDVSQAVKHVRATAPFGPGLLGRGGALFEWHAGVGVIALTANGVGGGSLINAGVAIEPDEDVLRQDAWPAALRHRLDAGDAAMEAATARARRMLGAAPWGEATAKTRALHRLREHLPPGARAGDVDLTIDASTCKACGDCTSGCNHGAKRTLGSTYLGVAAAHGAEIVSLATVRWIEPAAGGWRVGVLPTERVAEALAGGAAAQRLARVVHARQVVIAAGTFGSTELLQRSSERRSSFKLSPALGTRLSGNGDSLGFVADDPAAVDAMGAGAAALPAGGRFEIGPTITTLLDLRRDEAGALKPMGQRLLLQDGAVPGAIARAAQELVATCYLMAQIGEHGLRLPRSAAGRDPLAAGATARHTQVLLAMGHDGAQGRVVRVPQLDRSVPYWAGDPGEIEAYRTQADAFAALRRGGHVHLHAPNWQLLPPSAGTLMSGPPVPRMMVTVHPLGGCPMADHYDHGVVDDRGRVWKAPGEFWPGLHVLDGSIVPTSLGVNPLLTITALAERAMALLLPQWPRREDRHAAAAPRPVRGSALPQAPSLPAAFARPAGAAPAAVRASLAERLLCGPGALQVRAGSGEAPRHAELRLQLQSADWLATWDTPQHRFELERGRLRLEYGDSAHTLRHVTYDATSGWFELLPAAASMPFARPPEPAQGWWRRERAELKDVLLHLRHLAVPLTWYLLRGRDDVARDRRDRRAQRRPGRGLRERWEYLRLMARAMAHAAERRTMRYEIRLRRVGPGDTPPALRLVGTKDIGYGAGLRTLWRWWRTHGEAVRAGRGVPPPRPTFWEQVTDPHLALHDDGSGRPWLQGRFSIDVASLLAQPPLQLRTGDLTSGLQALGAYPALFLRHALKTHLFDLRLPDYAASAVCDGQAEGDVVSTRAGAVWPMPFDLDVERDSTGNDARGVAGLPKKLTLRLARYRRVDTSQPMLQAGSWAGRPVRRARAVLLLHAFAQSGSMYTLSTTQRPSPVAVLLEHGFDVWVLDHRISTRLPYVEWPSNIDQIARHDIPAAVDRILRALATEHALDDGGPPLQIYAFGQCIGAAALAMALLDARLSHGLPAAPRDPTRPPVPEMSKLAGVVISQTHPFLVGQPNTRARTWLPAMLRDGFGCASVPFGVRGPVDQLAMAWMDRLFASMPVPPGEQCPRERDAAHRQDDCATCRRIRFIEAPLFKHANLDDETHAALPRLFGDANLQLFAHAARCVENERLVDEQGAYVYVHDANMRRHFALPMAYLHGEDNELFHPRSADRAHEEYLRLFPALARRVDAVLGVADGRAWHIPGHGHVDVVIGRRAAELVFEPMARLFDDLWARDAGAVDEAPPLELRMTARVPRAGPWIGHVAATPAGLLRVHVAFLLDDRYSDGKAGPDAQPGLRTWAVLRSGRGALARHHLLRIKALAQRPTTQGSCGYRIAHGVVEVAPPPPGHSLLLRAASLHEMLVAEGQPLAPDQCPSVAPTPAELARPAFAQRWSALLIGRARDTRDGRRRTRVLDARLGSVSRQREEALDTRDGTARLLPAALRALHAGADAVCFAAASCRYPGWALDRDRVDAAARTLLRAAQGREAGLPAPAFAVLLGDQIYADATAGVVDPLAPEERYLERHRQAFARPPRPALGPRQAALGDLLASLPTYLTQDDHEFGDGWPDSVTLDAASVRVAQEAVLGFQRLHMPPALDGPSGNSYCFERGPLRVFVLDTRSRRRLGPPPRLASRAALLHLARWLADPAAAGALNCIATGSVVLPRLAPGSEPTDARDDSAAWAEHDRRLLLRLVRRQAAAPRRRRVLLLSGDYHLSAAAALHRRNDPAPFGAVVVAPALYAPLAYANAPASAVWWNEPLDAMALVPAAPAAPGSGIASIEVRRAGAGFDVVLRTWLQNHEQHEPDGHVGPPVTIHLP